MSNTTKRSRMSTVMTLTLGVLLLTLSAPAVAADPVQVMGTSVCGGNVNVTVKNTTLLPVVTTVTVQAVVNGSTTTGTATATLLPLQTSTLRASFGATVNSVVRVCASVGVVDDSTPF